MPVVLQPADSGFNSHLRGSSNSSSGGGAAAIVGNAGGAEEGEGEGAMPVPFLRILYEREVATLSMPHLRSLDLDMQVLSGAFKRAFKSKRDEMQQQFD